MCQLKQLVFVILYVAQQMAQKIKFIINNFQAVAPISGFPV